MSIKKSVLAVLALGLGLAMAGSVSAATCSNVEITIKNDTADEVKVTKFQYEDGGSWPTENMFGVDGHQLLEAGKPFTWTRDLQGTGGEKTRFKVTYQHHLGGTKWGVDKVVTTSPAFTCVDNSTKKTVSLSQ